MFRVEALSGIHDRRAFSCGEEALDRYFRTQVSQDIRRRFSNCFVAVEVSSGGVAGYYTLASTGVPLGDFPPEIVRRLSRYPVVPAARIGRLAVDQRFKGKGLGATLLADAAQRVISAAPAAYALVVDAKHAAAVAFYVHHGFQPLSESDRSLFLPLATAQKLWLP